MCSYTHSSLRLIRLSAAAAALPSLWHLLADGDWVFQGDATAGSGGARTEIRDSTWAVSATRRTYAPDELAGIVTLFEPADRRRTARRLVSANRKGADSRGARRVARTNELASLIPPAPSASVCAKRRT